MGAERKSTSHKGAYFHAGVTSHVIGLVFLALTLPGAVICVGSSVAWFYIDPLTPRLQTLVARVTLPAYRKLGLTRRPEDAFMVNLAVLHGIFVPALLFACFYHTVVLNGGQVCLPLALAYNLFRIGPYFNGFAYAYTMCHKEGHTRVGIFANKRFPNWWNWWIGLFYGVVPTNFSFGHSINHHQYNGGEPDVISTWDRPRDSFLNYARYIPRFLLYAINITSAMQFKREGKSKVMARMFRGTFVYIAFIAMFGFYSPAFAYFYLIYPFMESAMLLSAINWSWHSFLDPDEDNVFAYSVTILDGEPKTNILNEDFHVVHHQYPAAHWTEHPALYKKHHDDYISNKATILRGTHAIEIFFLAILRQYDVFAEKFVDLSGKMTHEEKKELVKLRLRHCAWGSQKKVQ